MDCLAQSASIVEYPHWEPISLLQNILLLLKSLILLTIHAHREKVLLTS